MVNDFKKPERWARADWAQRTATERPRFRRRCSALVRTVRRSGGRDDSAAVATFVAAAAVGGGGPRRWSVVRRRWAVVVGGVAP